MMMYRIKPARSYKSHRLIIALLILLNLAQCAKALALETIPAKLPPVDGSILSSGIWIEKN